MTNNTKKKMTSFFLTEEAFDKIIKYKKETKMRIFDLFFLLSLDIDKKKKIENISKKERKELRFRNLNIITDLLKKEESTLAATANDLILTAEDRELVKVKVSREAEALITKEAKKHKISTRAYLSAALDLRIRASSKSKKSLDKMSYSNNLISQAHFNREVFVTKETAEVLKQVDTQSIINSLVSSKLAFKLVDNHIERNSKKNK